MYMELIISGGVEVENLCYSNIKEKFVSAIKSGLIETQALYSYNVTV